MAHRQSAASPSSTGSMSAPSSRSRWSRCGWCAAAASSAAPPPARSAAAAACWARWRSTSSPRWSGATPSSSAPRSSPIEGMFENEAYVSRSSRQRPEDPLLHGRQVPALDLSRRRRAQAPVATPTTGTCCPTRSSDWLRLQRDVSVLPPPDSMLVETFPRGAQNYLVCYPFEGRLAHQTLGMLLTRRLERARARPLGFVASDYSLAIWGLGDFSALIRTGRLSLDELFDEDMLGDDLEAWLDEIAADAPHLPQLRHHRRADRAPPSGQGKDRPADHRLVRHHLRRALPARARPHPDPGDAPRRRPRPARYRAARPHARAASSSHIVHKPLDRISPLAVPVLLDIGKEPVFGEAPRKRHGRRRRRADAGGDGARIEPVLGGAGRSTDGEETPPCSCASPATTFEPLPSGALLLARRAARCWSPTCISRSSPPSPGSGSCCRPTTPALTLTPPRGRPRPHRRRARSSRWATASTATRAPRPCSMPTGCASLALLGRARWTWLSGNHDPAPHALGGVCLPMLERRGLTLAHEPRRGAAGLVAGHLHPGRAHRHQRPLGAPPLLRARRPAADPARLWRRHRRAQHPRPRPSPACFDWPALEVDDDRQGRVYPVSPKRLVRGR